MIVMYMRIQNDLDVLDSETERVDVIDDLLRGLRQVAINQDVTAIRRDQNCTKPVSADVVGTSEYAKWFLGKVPLSATGARYRASLPGGGCDKHARNQAHY